MNIFTGKYTRRKFIGHMALNFFVWMISMLSLAYFADHVTGLYNPIANVIMPIVTLFAFIYFCISITKRLRDIGITPWLTIAVIIFGPIGVGVIAITPSKKE